MHPSMCHANRSIPVLMPPSSMHPFPCNCWPVTFVHVLGNSDMFVNSICIKSDMHFNSDCMLFYILQDKCHLIGSYGVCVCTD